MRNTITMIGLIALLSGCSWLHGDTSSSNNRGGGSISGVDYGPGRGTTGVSSGADAGSGITGSDAAPP
jgi:hypothetical protein